MTADFNNVIPWE